MTISDSHRESYQTTVSQFERQSREDTCLPVAVFNILQELSERHDRLEVELEVDDLLDFCDHIPGLGSSAEHLPDRMAPVLEDHNFTISIERHLSLENLDELIEDQTSSFPIVELDPRYFDHAEGYEVQEGQFGRAMPHTVIPYKVNDETVLYFDPYEDFYAPDTKRGAPPREMAQVQFYELWSGRADTRWTLWIEERPQQTFDQFGDGS